MCNLSQLLGIKVATSTAYHPQTDGQTERVNQEVKQFLRLFVNQCQDDWYKWLSIAEFAYNNRVHTFTHSSPFMLDWTTPLVRHRTIKGVMSGNSERLHLQDEQSDR